MSSKSPIFPMPEPHHFSDYGFDPKIDYFQLLEEARKHKKETSRSIDSLHFQLQNSTSKYHHASSSKKMMVNKAKKKKKWWSNALLLFKWKWTLHHNDQFDLDYDVHHARAQAFKDSISGPVYITESRSGSSTPYRICSRTSSVPLAGSLTPIKKAEFEIPYLSLMDLNLEQQQRISDSAMPIYLVT